MLNVVRVLLVECLSVMPHNMPCLAHSSKLTAIATITLATKTTTTTPTATT